MNKEITGGMKLLKLTQPTVRKLKTHIGCLSKPLLLRYDEIAPLSLKITKEKRKDCLHIERNKDFNFNSLK